MTSCGVLGERLRRERHARRERQIDTGARFGVAQSTYARWETGGHRPEPVHYPAIADYLGVDVADVHTLVHGTDGPTTLDLVRSELAAAQRDVDDLRQQVELMVVNQRQQEELIRQLISLAEDRLLSHG